MSNILEKATAVVTDRQVRYGKQEESFTKTAQMWEVIFGHHVSAEQVCQCMIALKMVREMWQHDEDNLTDIAGYAHCWDVVSPKPNPDEQNLVVTKGPGPWRDDLLQKWATDICTNHRIAGPPPVESEVIEEEQSEWTPGLRFTPPVGASGDGQRGYACQCTDCCKARDNDNQ